MRTAKPLPSHNEVETKFLENPHASNAYNVCLSFEKYAQTQSDPLVLVHARVLGYLILYAPSRTALEEIRKEIHSCSGDNQKLSDLGESFINWFIRPFRKSKGRTPASSFHPSRPSLDKDKEELKLQLEEAPTDHTKAKNQALVRDSYQCIVTRKYDHRVWDEVPDFQPPGSGTRFVNTECAHIVPDSTYIMKSEKKKDYSAAVLTVLKRFGYDVSKLNGAGVHSLINVMTMQHDIHDSFDRLHIWFEEKGGSNCYAVKTVLRGMYLPETIELTSSDPNLSLPSKDLLKLHAACAKVANMSGAAETLDKWDRDMDESGVLASDGASFDILNHAIWKRAVRPVDVEA